MTGLNISHVKNLIVVPALTSVGLMSPAAANLVSGTALVESGLIELKQTGSGPALGLWQMEPATENDLWDNFLKFNPAIKIKFQSLITAADRTEQLVGNLLYAAAMCRLKYYRSPMKIPNSTDAFAMATMWKIVYNSSLGAGVVDAVHVSLFQQAINA